MTDKVERPIAILPLLLLLLDNDKLPIDILSYPVVIASKAVPLLIP